MTLQDTVALMNSADYKERFKAEYYQLENRFKGLKKMLEEWDREIKIFPTCPRSTYNIQLNAIGLTIWQF